jgi:hypothetical protein
MFADFGARCNVSVIAGFPLQMDTISPLGLIEVYPHPALLQLSNAPEHLPYKVSKV